MTVCVYMCVCVYVWICVCLCFNFLLRFSPTIICKMHNGKNFACLFYFFITRAKKRAWTYKDSKSCGTIYKWDIQSLIIIIEIATSHMPPYANNKVIQNQLVDRFIKSKKVLSQFVWDGLSLQTWMRSNNQVIVNFNLWMWVKRPKPLLNKISILVTIREPQAISTQIHLSSPDLWLICNSAGGKYNNNFFETLSSSVGIV